MPSSCVYTVYCRKSTLGLILCHLVQTNYEVGEELFLAIVLVCKLYCTEWHESGRVAVVF